MKKKFKLTDLDCANCAAKLEAKMNELPEVESVTLSFTTQQLYVEAENPDEVQEGDGSEEAPEEQPEPEHNDYEVVYMTDTENTLKSNKLYENNN